MYYIDTKNRKRKKLKDGRIKETIRYCETKKIFAVRYFNADNKLDGEAKFYNESGHLMQINQYKNDKPIYGFLNIKPKKKT